MKLAAYLLVSWTNLGTTQYTHNQSEVESRDYIEVYERENLKTDFFDKETST